MKSTQKEFLSSKMGDIGNIAMAALVFGQFFSKEPFEISIFFFGILFWVLCYLFGFLILEGGE